MTVDIVDSLTLTQILKNGKRNFALTKNTRSDKNGKRINKY